MCYPLYVYIAWGSVETLRSFFTADSYTTYTVYWKAFFGFEGMILSENTNYIYIILLNLHVPPPALLSNSDMNSE